MQRFGCAIVLAGLAGWSAIPVAAQSPAKDAAGSSVDTTPMTCWWMTDKGAVRVGELFGLTLTCRVMETAAAKVVPNLSEVEPTSIELTPFEVLQGTRHDDIVAPQPLAAIRDRAHSWAANYGSSGRASRSRRRRRAGTRRRHA